MNIATALKEKNRLKTTIVETIKKIHTNNRVREDNTSPREKVVDLIAKYDIALNKLVILKQKIAAAIVPVAADIAKLELLKQKKNMFIGMTCDGTPETVYKNGETSEVPVVLAINDLVRSQYVEDIDNQINSIQDKLDSFNAVTNID